MKFTEFLQTCQASWQNCHTKGDSNVSHTKNINEWVIDDLICFLKTVTRHFSYLHLFTCIKLVQERVKNSNFLDNFHTCREWNLTNYANLQVLSCVYTPQNHHKLININPMKPFKTKIDNIPKSLKNLPSWLIPSAAAACIGRCGSISRHTERKWNNPAYMWLQEFRDSVRQIGLLRWQVHPSNDSSIVVHILNSYRKNVKKIGTD